MIKIRKISGDNVGRQVEEEGKCIFATLKINYVNNTTLFNNYVMLHRNYGLTFRFIVNHIIN
jgi:hypothetical protein